jgi:hypothetical protein
LRRANSELAHASGNVASSPTVIGPSSASSIGVGAGKTLLVVGVGGCVTTGGNSSVKGGGVGVGKTDVPNGGMGALAGATGWIGRQAVRMATASVVNTKPSNGRQNERIMHRSLSRNTNHR